MPNRYNFVAYDYPVNMLKTVERNSVLYLHEEVDETIFTLSYLKNVLKKRQDVEIIDSYNNIFLSKNVPEKSKKYYSAVNTAKIKKSLYLNGLLWTEQKKSDKLIWDFYVIRELPKKYEYREQEVIARYSYFYGKFLIDSGNIKDGIFVLKKSLKVGPELIWLHNNVGDILRQQKDFDNAFRSLSDAISLDSSYSPAYYNMGLLYLEKKDDNNAIEYFKKAYQYDKTDSDSLFQLSKIYQRKGYENFVDGKIDDAITEYKKAIEYTPSSADIYYNIGVIYTQSQNNKEAKEYFQKYIQLKPGGPNAATVKLWFKNH
jgi:tetratricopeptide (TPR) repeat protein